MNTLPARRLPTAFGLLAALCGLSQRAAAAALGVRPDTVKSWSSGRNRAPAGVLAELARLALQIEDAARQGLEEAGRQVADPEAEPGAVALHLVRTDAEARQRGFPSAGAQHAATARVLAGLIAQGHAPRLVGAAEAPPRRGGAQAARGKEP